jgi:hypothetical protein
MKDPELEELIKLMEECLPLLEEMPEAPKVESQSELHWDKNQETLCCICQDYKHISEFRSFHTGYIYVFDPVCSVCEKEVSNTAYLVCVKCKSVVSRMKPHTDDGGFVFEKNKAYHLDRCPTCSDDCSSSTLAEKVIYDRRRKQ